jgi:hypothetical protein
MQAYSRRELEKNYRNQQRLRLLLLDPFIFSEKIAQALLRKYRARYNIFFTAPVQIRIAKLVEKNLFFLPLATISGYIKYKCNLGAPAFR